MQLHIFPKLLDVYVKLIAQVADVKANKICSVLMLVVLAKKQSEEILKLLSDDEEIYFYYGLAKNWSDHSREVNLTLLHTKILTYTWYR